MEIDIKWWELIVVIPCLILAYKVMRNDIRCIRCKNKINCMHKDKLERIGGNFFKYYSFDCNDDSNKNKQDFK